MICVTGGERSCEELARRLARHHQAALQEVRLDLLERLDDGVFELLARHPGELLVTCRGRAEGGGFDGTEVQRAEVLRRALAGTPRYLDLELSTPAELRRELYQQRGQTKLILSWHCFGSGGLQRPELQRLGRQPADLLKLALMVDDAAELTALQAALPGERPVLRIAMGAAGLLSRVLYPQFGSPWTYAAAEGAGVVAPGLPSTVQARRWRLGGPPLTPLALLGGPQVMRSPGPPVYNHLFVHRDLPFLYLPVVTSQPSSTLRLLERLGFAGCSVTMPAKEQLAGQVQHGSAASEELGAVNTVTLRDGKRTGHNTDLTALRRLLSPFAGRLALVLGTGGAARAALAALRGLGCKTAVAGRDPGRTLTMAQRLCARAVPWSARATEPFEVLVNATPVGSNGRQSPLPPQVELAHRVVLDAVIRSEPTPLLQQAEARGARTISGMQWWVQQGAEQISLLCGEQITVEQLQRAVRHA